MTMAPQRGLTACKPTPIGPRQNRSRGLAAVPPLSAVPYRPAADQPCAISATDLQNFKLTSHHRFGAAALAAACPAMSRQPVAGQGAA